MRLNRYIAHAGICARRKADELIAAGKISVNGIVVNEPGSRVKPGDVVKYGKKQLKPERYMYVLLNKPKDLITSTSDDRGRKTVIEYLMPLLKNNSLHNNLRLYPVGRLDRNTTGVLLITNDGELMQNLTHPSREVSKVYLVTLDNPLEENDRKKLLNGVLLEDGPIKFDNIDFPDTYRRQEVGVEIHSGRNRIVRRTFEALGYNVIKLDRTLFAGLTKKDLPRGKWRFLKEEEVVRLKHFKQT